MANYVQQPGEFNVSIAYGDSWEFSSTWSAGLIAALASVDIEIVTRVNSLSSDAQFTASTTIGADALITIAGNVIAFNYSRAAMLARFRVGEDRHIRIYATYTDGSTRCVAAGRFNYGEVA